MNLCLGEKARANKTCVATSARQEKEHASKEKKGKTGRKCKKAGKRQRGKVEPMQAEPVKIAVLRGS